MISSDQLSIKTRDESGNNDLPHTTGNMIRTLLMCDIHPFTIFGTCTKEDAVPNCRVGGVEDRCNKFQSGIMEVEGAW